MKDMSLDLDSIRARLEGTRGKEFWRGLEELADSEGFKQLVQREFPRQAAGWLDGVSRRDFLKLAAASLALAGLSGCSVVGPDQIVPYVRKPEEVIPGIPLYFATAAAVAGSALGLLVESHEGRPTKIEGNPNHPASLGATDAFTQASLLALYDPDRSAYVMRGGQISSWDTFLAEFGTALNAQKASRGAGLRILTQTVNSPTMGDQLKTILRDFPSAKWHQYEPAGGNGGRMGSQMAFGQYVNSVLHLEKADVILALDSDFLMDARYAHDFAARRQVGRGQPPMSRLYVVESTPTITGSVADNRLPLRAADIASFARAVAVALGVGGIQGATPPSGVPADWIPALVKDLQAHRGSSVVIAGGPQPPAVHALAAAMNDALGAAGSTVVYTDPVEANPVDQMASLRDLVNDMNSGAVKMLVILDGNPVYNTPADLQFGAALKKVPLSAHLSLFHDETSAQCTWHLPAAHYLEAWGDTRAFEGTAAITQPLVAPFYGGKSAIEVLANFGNTPNASGLDVVKGYWQGQHQGGDFDQFWRSALNTGIVPNTALPTKQVALKTDWAGQLAAAAGTGQLGVEIVFRPDPAIADGRFANIGWLQELPKPLTRLTWDNVVVVSPGMAERMGLAMRPGLAGGEHGHIISDVVELRYQGRTVSGPVYIMPGQPDNSVTVYFGYGRSQAGRVGNGVGYNAYSIWTSNAPTFGGGLELRKTGAQHNLAIVQFHHTLEGRNLIYTGTFQEYQKDPALGARESANPPPEVSMYPAWPYPGSAWGMAIDLGKCVGCNACVVACQAENNSPVIGKEQVLRAREMHWLRIDTYYTGNLDNPTTYFQPVPCMHCETAPCEPVCPVHATVHSSDGLNDMVYNRCVGTRYCSNNCPYKVRRFNFFQFADYQVESLKPMYNPNVTVRSRGVMEKCSYCVQRIRQASIKAEIEGRPVRDGEILTACQAACPTGAIIFGDINDANSQVAKLKAEPRNYALLAELNTRPRTTYLAAVRNPNPEIKEG